MHTPYGPCLLRARFEGIHQRSGGTNEEVFSNLDEQLELYAGGLEVVGSMLEMDFASAVSFIEPFDEVFDQMNADIVSLSEAAIAEANARAEAANASAARTKWMFGIATLIVALGLTAVAFGFASRGA